MRTTLKLEFNIGELPDKPKDALRNGFCIDDDEDHLWCDINSLIDGIAEGRFKDVNLPDVINDPPTVNDLPKAWWDFMQFPAPMTRKMKKFWRENRTGEIEWAW
jgi:hypothetical protein